MCCFIFYGCFAVINDRWMDYDLGETHIIEGGGVWGVMG